MTEYVLNCRKYLSIWMLLILHSTLEEKWTGMERCSESDERKFLHGLEQESRTFIRHI